MAGTGQTPAASDRGMDSYPQNDNLAHMVWKLLLGALSGDRVAELLLRDLALFDEDAADAYLVALQAGVETELLDGTGPAAPAIVAICGRVEARLNSGDLWSVGA